MTDTTAQSPANMTTTNGPAALKQALDTIMQSTPDEMNEAQGKLSDLIQGDPTGEMRMLLDEYLMNAALDETYSDDYLSRIWLRIRHLTAIEQVRLLKAAHKSRVNAARRYRAHKDHPKFNDITYQSLLTTNTQTRNHYRHYARMNARILHLARAFLQGTPYASVERVVYRSRIEGLTPNMLARKIAASVHSAKTQSFILDNGPNGRYTSDHSDAVYKQVLAWLAAHPGFSIDRTTHNVNPFGDFFDCRINIGEATNFLELHKQRVML
jgi:hypothetical protein